MPEQRGHGRIGLDVVEKIPQGQSIKCGPVASKGGIDEFLQQKSCAVGHALADMLHVYCGACTNIEEKLLDFSLAGHPVRRQQRHQKIAGIRLDLDPRQPRLVSNKTGQLPAAVRQALDCGRAGRGLNQQAQRRVPAQQAAFHNDKKLCRGPFQQRLQRLDQAFAAGENTRCPHVAEHRNRIGLVKQRLGVCGNGIPLHLQNFNFFVACTGVRGKRLRQIPAKSPAQQADQPGIVAVQQNQKNAVWQRSEVTRSIGRAHDGHWRIFTAI